MRSRFIVFAGIALLVCWSAAAFGEPLTRKVTGSDNGRSVALQPGEMLVVELASTPGTGYGWTVHRFDRKVLKEIGQSRLIHRPHPMPGAPATQVFRFSAAAPGLTTLELDYIRPWEKKVPPARVFRLGVTVR